jgi:RHS repeat-associated protein
MGPVRSRRRRRPCVRSRPRNSKSEVTDFCVGSGYRLYNPSTGRWPNRDPLGDKAFLDKESRKRGRRAAKRFHEEALLPSYVFVRNSPVTQIDAEGLALTLPPATWPAVAAGAAGFGVGCLIDRGGCWARVVSALCEGERAANRVAPDGSEHHSRPLLCRADYNYDIQPREGDDADLLTHCITACRLTQDPPWPCWGAGGALKALQSREDRASAGSIIDWRNNNVGSGVGINIGPQGDCVQGCLDALNNRLLYTIENGHPSPEH